MQYRVILFLLSSFSCYHFAFAQIVTGPNGEQFSYRIVKDGLSDPWEVTYGPDQYLWVTEAKGYIVSRINPATGNKTVLLDLNNQRDFPRYDQIPDSIDGGKHWPQGGLTGLTLHPSLLTGKPYVYLSYVYHFKGADKDSAGCAANFGGCYYTTRVVRYEYDQRSQKLTKPVIICDSIPASSDHNGARLVIAPVNGTNYLFYSVGDMGAGQHENVGRPNHAQLLGWYEGKILRFNAEPDTDADQYDQWIPNDNPFNTTRQSAVWTIGHRNPQGMAYGITGGVGKIYTAEHGPFGDDEVNIIVRAKNYGHPLIIGYNDDNYNGYAAGVSEHETLPAPWHTTYPVIVSEHQNVLAIGADHYADPIKSFCVASPDSLKSIFQRTVSNDPNHPDWPAEAPSSIEVYTSNAIPGWNNSLLIPTLKTGHLIRLKLNNTGMAVTGDTINYFKTSGRYRDIAVSKDGTKIYLGLDSIPFPDKKKTEQQTLDICTGCIIEFTYRGIAKNADPSNKVKTR